MWSRKLAPPAVVFNTGQSRVTLAVAATGQGIKRVQIRGTTPLPIYDDGTPGDHQAGDGIYTLASVGASSPATSLIVPVARSVSRQIQTGIAITSVGVTAHLVLTLRNDSGQPVANGSRTLDLAANGHEAKYLAELFPNADTNEFEGTVTLVSTGGQIAATAIELGSAAGQFTTFPVSALR